MHSSWRSNKNGQIVEGFIVKGISVDVDVTVGRCYLTRHHPTSQAPKGQSRPKQLRC